MFGAHKLPPPRDKPGCNHCAAARLDHAYGLFDMTCLGCIARHLAESPAAWRATREADGEALTEAIRNTWGERYAEGRKAVWEWMQYLRAQRNPT